MYMLILTVLCFLSGITYCEAPDQKSRMRTLAIFLDDITETTPDQAGATITDLNNALMAGSTPILVTASVWRTFLALRQEWLLFSNVPGTNEHKIACCINMINDRVNYWHDILCGTCDDVQIQSLIAEKINEEFFTKEKYQELQKDGRMPKSRTEEKLYHYARLAASYDFESWYWFYVDTGYYLAIPHDYAARYTSSSQDSDILEACGFLTSLAISHVDPLCIDPIQHMQTEPLEETIMPTLQKLFLHGDVYKKTYTWSFYIAGHGLYSVAASGGIKEVVGLSFDTFKKICQFFDTQLFVHMLWVATCNAGGVQRIELHDHGNITYHYALVVECLGDNASATNLNIPSIYRKPFFHCKRDFISKNAIANRWELWYKNSEQFTKFFEKIRTLNFSEQSVQRTIQNSLFDAFKEITPQEFVENTPYVLLPRTTHWRLCYPWCATYLNVQAAILQEVCKAPHLLHTNTTLIEAPVLKAGFSVANENIDFITVISPGDSTHYVGPVQATDLKIEKFISYFWPSFRQKCTKCILFESITCQCDPKDPLVQMLGVTEKTVTFKDVLMRIVKSEQIELVFTTSNNEVFYATVRSVDGKPMFRNLQKLSEKAVKSYRDYYDKTKTELFAQSEELYAPLRNHYQQAMNLF